jgi:hypothetical protein
MNSRIAFLLQPFAAWRERRYTTARHMLRCSYTNGYE